MKYFKSSVFAIFTLASLTGRITALPPGGQGGIPNADFDLTALRNGQPEYVSTPRPHLAVPPKAKGSFSIGSHPPIEQPSGPPDCPEAGKAHRAWNASRRLKGVVFTEFKMVASVASYCVYIGKVAGRIDGAALTQRVIVVTSSGSWSEEITSLSDPSLYGDRVLERVRKVAGLKWRVYELTGGVFFHELADRKRLPRVFKTLRTKESARNAFVRKLRDSIFAAQQEKRIVIPQTNIDKMLFVENGGQALFSVQFIDLSEAYRFEIPLGPGPGPSPYPDNMSEAAWKEAMLAEIRDRVDWELYETI